MVTSRKRLFGTSGIRGIPGQDLTLDFVTEMAQAIGTFFEKGPILVGHDTRHTGPTLAKAVAAALMSVGLEVGEAGLLPTPALQYCVRKMEYNGGVMITASHNPSQYNGMKVSGIDGIDTTRDEERIIENIYYNKNFKLADWKTVGNSFHDTKTIRAYTEGILSQVNVDQIRKRRFRVVVDPGNGAQCVAAPYILERLNCKPVSLNAQPDGDFPGRGAEPTPEVLKGLSEAVKTYSADMGVAYDGDGDRSLFCDETGVVHYGDRSAALLTDYILTQNPSALIVTTVSASQAIDDIVKARGGRLFKTKVGSVDVSNAMVERGALFGLEENGGCFYAPHIPVRDGAMTSVLLLEAMSKSGKPLSEMLNSLPSYYQQKTKFECAHEKVPGVMERIATHAKGKVETIDGIKIWVDDKTWILLRPSGTEPVLRVFAESDRKDKLDTTINEYSEIVKDELKQTIS
jgi:phosphomannomutase/phosphoglucomutase